MSYTPSWSELWYEFKLLVRSTWNRIEEDIDISPKKKGKIVKGTFAELLKPGLVQAFKDAYREDEQSHI